MFIHVGSREIVSDKSIVGIFNIESLKKNTDNSHYLTGIDPKIKAIIIDTSNRVIKSIVSPYTIIKRTEIKKDIVWRRDNDERV